MAVPGLSASQLLRAVAKAKDVWDAFFDEHGNAPARVKELKHAVDFLESALGVCQGLSQLQGLPLPFDLVDPLRGKLEECHSFKRKYQHLTVARDPAQSQTLRQASRRGLSTVRYAFDGDALTLKNDLMFEAQKLTIFAQLLQLGLLVFRTNHAASSAAAVPSSGPTLPSTPAAPSSGNSTLPSAPVALHPSDATRFLETNPGLSSLFAVPPSLSNNQPERSRRSGWRSWTGWSRRRRSRSQASTATSLPTLSLTPQLPENGTTNDGDTIDANRIYCSAIMVVDSQSTYPLQSYSIHQTDSGPMVEWKGSDGALLFYHYVGPDTLAITKHSVNRQPPYQVHFPHQHRVIIWGRTGLGYDNIVSVKYQFVSNESLRAKRDFERFQGRLCGKELVGGRFECHEIRSRRKVEATNQHLKLWKSVSIPTSYILTFYVGTTRARDQRPHRVFPVRWFERAYHDVDLKKTPHTVKLRFLDPFQIGQLREVPSRRISWSRTSFSFSLSGSLGSSAASTGASTPRDHRFTGPETSIDSALSLSTSPRSPNHIDNYAPQNIISDVGFLQIQFSSATDMENFKAAFNEALESIEAADVREDPAPARESGVESDPDAATPPMHSVALPE